MHSTTGLDREFELSDKAVAALLKRVGEGDKAALATLYDKTHRLMFGLTLAIVGNAAEAEESLLDAYTHIWKRASIRGQKTPAREETPALEWMLRIVRLQALSKVQWSRRRQGKPRMAGDGPIADGPIADPTVAPQSQQHARTLLASIPGEQRDILEWTYGAGLSCEAIAAETGKPVGAVKALVRRAMYRLCEPQNPETGPAGGNAPQAPAAPGGGGTGTGGFR